MIEWEKFKDIYYLSLFSYSRKRHIQLAKLPVCRVTHIALIYLLFDIYHVQARCFLGTCCTKSTSKIKLLHMYLFTMTMHEATPNRVATPI